MKINKKDWNRPLKLYYKIYLLGIALLPVPLLLLSLNLEEDNWIQDKLFIAPLIYIFIWAIFFAVKNNWNIFKK